MPGPRFVGGDRVSLHVVAEEDHAFLQRHWNHPEIRPGFGNPGPVTAGEMADRIESIADSDEEETFLVCAGGTETNEAGGDDADAADAPEPIGEAFLFDCQRGRGTVEIGYWIAPAHQGKGYATETAELLVAYLFEEQRCHKVNARVLAFNEASRRVLESVGFDHEGRRREEFYVEGEYVDADLYGLLESEWEAAGGAATAGRVD